MENYLMHSGRKGMKWYQHIYANKDGSLNNRGQKHYAIKAMKKELKTGKYSQNSIGKEYRSWVNAHNRVENIKNKKGIPTNEIKKAYNESNERGKKYINSEFNRDVYKQYVKAFSLNKIKAGKDYLSDRQGNVKLTETGRKKESDIINKVTKSKYDHGKSRNTDYLAREMLVRKHIRESNNL